MGVNAYEYLTFDGVSTAEFGVWVSGSGTFDAPARDIETISVPGRNGDLYHDNGRYRNITVSYPCFISSRFQPRMDDFRAWLCSHVGYFRLEDTYHPDEFRMALFKAAVSVSTAPRNLAGRFTLSFDCKPQRWLKSGENAIEYSASGKIYNPTEYDAYPLLRLYGTAGASGNFNITGSRRLEITVLIPSNGYIDIDTENGEAYVGDTSYNSNVTFHSTNTWLEFPKIEPGENNVNLWALSKASVIPRWWRI